MLRKIRQTIEEKHLLAAGHRVMVGVSGGADSVALTYALHYLSAKLRIHLSMVHVNHMIRGAEAEEDAGFVRNLAWRLGLPFFVERRNVPALAAGKGISLEMAAREARYDVFRERADLLKADCVAVAHTMDDHAETVLLRLARGAGTQGLGGIPYEHELYGLRVVRPMRDVSHAEAVDFLKAHGLPWREDVTNQDMQFMRNRVRHEVLPVMETRLNPRIREALARGGDILREESDWINEMADAILERCREPSNPATLSARRLKRHPEVARRRTLLRWLISEGLAAESLTFDALARVDRLVDGSSGTKSVPLGGGWNVIARYGNLALERKKTNSPPAYRQVVSIPGETLLPEQGLRVVTAWGQGVVRQEDTRAGTLPAQATFKASSMEGVPLIVRSWQAGDRIKPLGMQGSKKIQDLFVDEKVPKDRRTCIPLLECRDQVIWVPGYQVARGWEVAGSRGRSLHVTIERTTP